MIEAAPASTQPTTIPMVPMPATPSLWDRFYNSFLRFIETPQGKEAYFDLVAGVEAAVTTDAGFDGFRRALETSGMSADTLLDAAEKKLESRRKKKEEPAPKAENESEAKPKDEGGAS